MFIQAEFCDLNGVCELSGINISIGVVLRGQLASCPYTLFAGTFGRVQIKTVGDRNFHGNLVSGFGYQMSGVRKSFFRKPSRQGLTAWHQHFFGIMRKKRFSHSFGPDNISTTEAFLKDKILIGSAKYYLQVSIECCLDIANHIIASERFRAPKDYADSFKILEEMNIIPGELSRKLQQMAKFRNRLVHLYGEIDNQYVYDFIREDIDDIREFTSMIKNRYLESGLNETE